MKLSEAMRQAGTCCNQTFEVYAEEDSDDTVYVCALTGAYIIQTGRLEDIPFWHSANEAKRATAEAFGFPVERLDTEFLPHPFDPYEKLTVFTLIAGCLNDQYRWTFEQIADYLQAYDW